MKNIYLTGRLYGFLAVSITLFAISGVFDLLFFPVVAFFTFGFILTIFESLILTLSSGKLTGNRRLHEKLFLGDKQEIRYTVKNFSSRTLKIRIFDDLPAEFQQRGAVFEGLIKGNEKINSQFTILPVDRGLCQFGECHVVYSLLFPGFLKYKKRIEGQADMQVHPSVLQMKKYEMMVVSGVAHRSGLRRVRMVGENDEFEHIRHYTQGDHIKSINWKATARKQELLVNTFHDSRSQEVYCIIDKGRTMEMPFHGMTLMDYAINTSLVLSNIVLQKFDKSGIITFSNHLDEVVPASSNAHHLNRISDVLYHQSTEFKESDFQLLYGFLRKNVRKRSILFLFTNFEDPYEIERNMTYLRMINKYHLLIIICFVNEEIESLVKRETSEKTEIYQNVIALDTLHKRASYLQNLTAFGVQLIMVKPADLSIAVINKYLEIKSKRQK